MYHVCHKCGLARSKTPDATDLGSCICIGQTWFEYEMQARTETEARQIAVQHYHDWRMLYGRQDSRTARDYERLDRQYSKVLH